MIDNVYITASIVIYNHSKEELSNLIETLILSCIDKIFIIDNSIFKGDYNFDKYEKIDYCFLNTNPGFGTSHNIAINKAKLSNSKFHFVINPDIELNFFIIEEMCRYIILNKDVGMMMPKILNNDGSIQYLPKLLPTPFLIFVRSIKILKKIFSSQLFNYELRQVNENKIINVPILSGCFTLLRIDAIIKCGSYDEIFFMYFEDWDLSRRIHKEYKTVYWPSVSVFHGYAGGAKKNIKLFKIFISSYIKYFNKWGWLFDFDRNLINKNTINEVEK
jgi:GT2 family glycosyltransferase